MDRRCGAILRPHLLRTHLGGLFGIPRNSSVTVPIKNSGKVGVGALGDPTVLRVGVFLLSDDRRVELVHRARWKFC
eukprot:8896260-Pyramimonas_sp.AAC.1